jgi:hypothetical protein
VKKAIVSRLFVVGEGGKIEPLLAAYVSDNPKTMSKERVQFTNEHIAKELGLLDAVVPTEFGPATIESGVDYVRNLWKLFAGTNSIECDKSMLARMPVPATMHARNSPRGEPAVDPMDDVEGEYQRFQEREQQ